MATTTKQPLVTFRRRGRTYETAAARGTIWESVCGRYRIRRSKLLGKDSPVLFYSQFLSGEVWYVIFPNRTRKAAEKACEKHAKTHGGEA